MKPSSSMSRSRDSLPASAQLRLGLEPVRPPRFLAQAVPAGWETEADVELSNGLASMNLSGSKTGLSSAESFPKVGETCPYDCLLALGIQTTPLETAAEPPSPTPPIPIISSVAYAIIDVQDASINYSSELFVGAGSSAENSESAPLAGLIASLDKEIQERIVDANKSFCVIVYDGSSFERTAFISSAEQSVELPAYFNTYFDFGLELKRYVAQHSNSNNPELSPLEQLLPPKGSDGRPPRYAESQGLNRVLAMAHLCVRLLAANFAPTAGDQSPPFTRPRRRNDPQTPGSAPSSPNRRHEYKPGDWSCMTCGYSNYAARRQCYKCQTPHPAEFNMQGYPMGVPMDSYFPAYRGQMQYPPRLRPYRMGGPLSPGGGSTGYVDSPAVSPLVGSAAGPNAGAIRHGSETTVTPPSVNSPSPATPSETAVGGTEWGSGFPTPSSPSTVTDPSQQLSPPRLTQKVLPGDWICGVCSVTNFSSRTECVSCRSGQHLARGTITMPMPSFPPTYGRPMMPMPMQMAYAVPGSMSPMGTQMIAVGMPQMNAAYGFPGSPGRDVHYGSKPRPSDRPGDWNCPNPSCKYHNYASRTQCYRCSTARPPYAGIGMDQFIRPGQPYVRLPAGMPMSPMPMSPSVWSSYPVQPGAPRIPVLFGGPAPFGYGYPTTMMQAPSDESQAEAEEEAFFGVEEQYIVETEVLVDQQHQEA